MSIVNRRNAVVGWLAWTAGKRIARRKVRGAVPKRDAESKRPRAGAIVSAAAAGLGALWFLRRRRADVSGRSGAS